MKVINVLLLSLVTVLAACSSLVPVAVTCPKPPPLPEALMTSPSTEPSLSERYDRAMQEFKNSLSKATKQKPSSLPQ